MTSPSRAFAVLDLFTAERPIWQVDDIHERLGYTRATGYRYVKDLVEAGFLQKVSAGQYALGARIIELDYQLRCGDPLLRAAAPVLPALVKRSRLDAVLTAMYGTQLVDIHRVSGATHVEPRYGRGRPRPLFQGAAAKVLLANLARARLARIHARFATEIADVGFADDWASFRDRLAEIRRDGFYLSRGELEPRIGAAAVPLLDEDGDVIAALALAGPLAELRRVPEARLRGWLDRAALEIAARRAASLPAGRTRGGARRRV